MCIQWESFAIFLEDMGQRPSLGHTLDRIDNSKGYFKENCRWATSKEQARNRGNNRLIDFDGKVLCVREWEDLLGVKKNLIHSRLSRGWSVERALTEATYYRGQDGRRSQ